MRAAEKLVLSPTKPETPSLGEFFGRSSSLTATDYFKESRGIHPNVALAGEQLLHNVESPVADLFLL
jgi:hypothetical protein